LALAAPADPATTVQQFEAAWTGASRWQDLQAFFSRATLQALTKLKPAQQAATFTEMSRLRSTLANPTVDQKIKGNQASVRLHSEQTHNGNLTSNTRTYDLDLEGGSWKIDFQDAFDGDDGSDED
jgi:hypothetical protein